MLTQDRSALAHPQKAKEIIGWEIESHELTAITSSALLTSDMVFIASVTETDIGNE